MRHQIMHRQRKFILIAAALGVTSIFLPWITISLFGVNKSINGFQGWGILAFSVYLVAGIITLIGKRKKPLEKNLWVLIVVCGAIALLSVIIEIISSSDSYGEETGFADTGFGAGVWLAIVASAAMLLFAWIFKNPVDNLKNGFDGFKKSISIRATSINFSAQNKIDEFEKISILKNNGSVSEEEYQQLKSKLI